MNETNGAGPLRYNAEEANRRKDEFLAMLAHELRNPLAPIVNTLHVLRLDEMLTTEQRKGLELIDRQAKHLIRLVDDLLDRSHALREAKSNSAKNASSCEPSLTRPLRRCST